MLFSPSLYLIPPFLLPRTHLNSLKLTTFFIVIRFFFFLSLPSPFSPLPLSFYLLLSKILWIVLSVLSIYKWRIVFFVCLLYYTFHSVEIRQSLNGGRSMLMIRVIASSLLGIIIYYRNITTKIGY